MERTGFPVAKILELYGISRSRWYDWLKAKGVKPKAPKRNLLKPLPDELEAVLKFRALHPGVGYRKFTHMLNDANTAFLTESAVFRILQAHNLLAPRVPTDDLQKAGKEYKDKPTTIHEHWHMDIAYIKIHGIFYFLVMMLDGYSRFLLDWELMSDMLGSSVESFVQRVHDKYPSAKPKLITDNGCQFISRDFKALLHQVDIQHVRTRRNHPQTNGKIERLNGTVKHEAIFPSSPQSFAEAVQVLHEFAYFYNYHRLHSGIKFLRPADMFFGRQNEVLTKRYERVKVARGFRIEANRSNPSLIPSHFS